MKHWIVLNYAKTEGFATDDEQLAYEVRKGSDTNCCTAEGRRCNMAIEFCERYSWHEDCTMARALVADDGALVVLKEMLERTTRGVAQTAKEIDRKTSELFCRPEHRTPARTERIEANLKYLREIHAYQERVLRTLHQLLI